MRRPRSRNTSFTPLPPASLLATVAFAPTTARAQHRCDHPGGLIDKRACEKAAEGPDALRNFVSRTRMIWGLYYWDYAPRDEQGAAASAPVKPVATDSKAVAIATDPR